MNEDLREAFGLFSFMAAAAGGLFVIVFAILSAFGAAVWLWGLR